MHLVLLKIAAQPIVYGRILRAGQPALSALVSNRNGPHAGSIILDSVGLTQSHPTASFPSPRSFRTPAGTTPAPPHYAPRPVEPVTPQPGPPRSRCLDSFCERERNAPRTPGGRKGG